MIDKVLGFLLDRLNAALQHQYPSGEPHAVSAGLGGPEAATLENKIVLSIANIERETGTQTPVNVRPDATGFNRTSAPLNVNLLILVTANFGDNYGEALKLLSAALSFFQSSAVMTPTSASAFPVGLERLTVELVNLSIQELSSLWTIQGSRYLPSFLLKLRTVTIAKGEIVARAPAITGIDAGPSSK
jgi:hypothetical protein